MHPKLNERNLERCAKWNEEHPIGTPVTLRKSDDSILETKTRSEAWILGHGQIVVSVEGLTGGWEIERVRRRTPDAGVAAAVKAIVILIVCAAIAACVPPQGTPGYSLAGPSGNATAAQRTAPPVEGSGGTQE